MLSSIYETLKSRRRAIKKAWRTYYARLRRQTSRAVYIAVTGSSAKSTTVALLSHILDAKANVKSQVLSNGESETIRTLSSVTRAQDYVVLEFDTATQGRIRQLANLARPDVAIVTMVGLDHYTVFRSKEAIAAEKGALIEALPRNGIAILNADDPYVMGMAARGTARVVTFGRNDADYRCGEVSSTQPGQLAFTLEHRGRRIALRTRLTGVHNCLAVSAAAACALELGVPEVIVRERVAGFEPIFGRLSIHAIEGGPTFIVDTIKAPFESVSLAVDVLADCAAPRRRFILGHISDYAGNPRAKYRDTYRAALQVADEVIFIGDHAHRSKATAEDIAAGRFKAFHTVRQLSDYLKATAVPGEVILLKSSANLHLQRLMLDWTKDVKCWRDACGVRLDCTRCGLYDRSYAEHRGRVVMFNPERRKRVLSR